MTTKEGGLVIVIFFLLFLITILLCCEWQVRKNEMLRFEALQAQIEQLREENKTQDSVMDSVIRNQARHGWFDKKESK